MTTIEYRSTAAQASDDLRELVPYLTGLARAVAERAAKVLEAQADLLAIAVPAAEHHRVVEQLAAHHELTTDHCHVCGWSRPTADLSRRFPRRAT